MLGATIPRQQRPEAALVMVKRRELSLASARYVRVGESRVSQRA